MKKVDSLHVLYLCTLLSCSTIPASNPGWVNVVPASESLELTSSYSTSNGRAVRCNEMYIARTGVAGSTLSVRFSVTIDEYVGEFQRIGELHIAGKVYALEGVGVSTYVLGAQYRKMTWVELGENPVFGGYFDSYRGLWIDGLNGNPDEGYYEEEVLQQTFFNYTVQFDYNLPVSAFKESNSGDKHSIVLNFEKENITVEHQESLIDSVVALTSAAKRRFENVNTVDKPAGN